MSHRTAGSIVLGLALAAVAGVAQSTPPRPPGAQAAIRDGYALAADPAPEAAGLPRAYDSARGFNDDLDLPEIAQYADPVLRFTSTGLAPTLVVQLATVRPGASAQVMVVRATGPSHLKEATRVFGELPWAEFETLRGRALNALLQTPPPPPPPIPAAAPGAGDDDVSVSAVDQVCTLEYGEPDVSVRRQVACHGGDGFDTLTNTLLEIADRTIRRAAVKR